jgi:hypothetical protein
MGQLIKEWYNENAILCQYQVNEDGIKDGDFRSWSPEGTLEVQCTYVKGKVIGTKKYWDSKGTLIKEIDFDFDGNPFVVRFFADDWTEEIANSIGLVADIENLTLANILKRFREVQDEKDDAVAYAQEVYREPNDKEPNNQAANAQIDSAQLMVNLYSDNKTRITFT